MFDGASGTGSHHPQPHHSHNAASWIRQECDMIVFVDLAIEMGVVKTLRRVMMKIADGHL